MGGDIKLLIAAREASASGRGAQLRKAANLSQVEIGNACGVSAPCVCRWEDGTRRPTGAAAVAYGRVLREIASALNKFEAPTATGTSNGKVGDDSASKPQTGS